MALGNNVAGLMANDDEWPPPSVKPVRALVKNCGNCRCTVNTVRIDHPHADINNISGRTAGSITAGLFLKEFVDDKVKWAHWISLAPV